MFFIMKTGQKIFLFTFIAVVIVLTGTTVLLIKNANRIIKHELDHLLGKDFTVQEIRLKWNEVEALNVSYKNSEGKIVFRTDSLVLSTDFTGLLKKDYTVSNAVLKNPYLFFETDKKGHLKMPFPSQKEKGGEKPSPALRIQKIEIENGSLDYLDRKAPGEPVLTELRDINLESENIIFPLKDNLSDYRFTARISGKLSAGTVQSQGKINMKTLDMDSKIKVNDLDVTHFKPYFQKKGDMNIKRGFLDLNMDVNIISGKIKAPGRAALKDLQFESAKSAGGKFLSLPAHAVLLFLRDKGDQIDFHFILEGDLGNPKFSIREGLVERLSLGIAGKLGLPLKKIGESVTGLGAEGVKQIGEGMKGAGEGVRKIFQ
jgi:Domain of Unknown Function (DUF748)